MDLNPGPSDCEPAIFLQSQLAYLFFEVSNSTVQRLKEISNVI
jgi:hypothetical protein